ncbi:hypothetical protein [Alicyclobacillus fodiniaquatilis]|uniref:DUF4179 domain-containing protein n=1 Tax=Alicyclobacillus fodiniaquatilis TaxID=1661150 RepID=A0ABW4JM20_9BACL
MSEAKDPIKLYSDLSKVEMPPDKSEEIWSKIELATQAQKGHGRFKTLLKRLGPIGAACAAVIIFLIGINTIRQQSISHTTVSEGTVKSIQPVEITSGNWALAIYKSLLKPGPYYEVSLIYIGKKTLSMTESTMLWEGSKSVSPGGPPIQPGTQESAISMLPIPNGLAKTPPLVFKWSTLNSKNDKVTFTFADAKPIQVTNIHRYAGHDSKWTVQYAYETVKGKEFSYPYGVLNLRYNGKQMPSKVSLTFDSQAGKQQKNLFYNNIQENSVSIPINPELKGYNITASTAYVTIKSNGVSDRITLTKQ